MLGAGIEVVLPVIAESVLSVGVRFVGMSSMPDYALYSLAFQQMRNPCAVVSRVQPHILWQLPKPLLDFRECFGPGRNVVDVRGLYVYVHDHIMQIVHCAVLAVMEAVRLAIPRLLTALPGSVVLSINSFQPDFELYYSVYAAVAQSERESNHDNLAISIQHKIKDGTSKLYSRPCYGYKLDRNGEFVIVQEEAEVVKLVFNLYLDGLSILGIMRELEQRGITSPSGKTKWCRRSIDLMLENEKYRGNSVATAPTLSDAPKDLPRRRYMLSMHHEGIISSEQFDDVQKERERRSNIEFDENGTHRKKTQYRAKLKISEDGSISIEQEPD